MRKVFLEWDWKFRAIGMDFELESVFWVNDRLSAMAVVDMSNIKYSNGSNESKCVLLAVGFFISNWHEAVFRCVGFFWYLIIMYEDLSEWLSMPYNGHLKPLSQGCGKLNFFKKSWFLDLAKFMAISVWWYSWFFVSKYYWKIEISLIWNDLYQSCFVSRSIECFDFWCL